MTFPSLLDGLARTVTIKRGKNCRNDSGREAAEALAKDAKKKELMLSSSGNIKSNKSNNFASVCSKRGQKGSNQDSAIVWEEFGCQEDMIFCGIFDGHGPWGHVVAKRVRESVPSSLLCNWQETLSNSTSAQPILDRNLHQFDIWKQTFLKTYAAIDKELKQQSGIDSFRSGSTALTIVKQGENLAVANVGDSRAVLATLSDDGNLVPLQLTIDFKPNLPEEAERIIQSKGLVFCLHDEPGVYRVWMPNGETPGLAISRAFGDYCVKDFGLISVPHVTLRDITRKDQFVILATDGVWDVISNQEAVEIVSSTGEREQSAKRLVECAARAWKYKKRGIAMDDISAVCLFFHASSSSPPHVDTLKLSKQAAAVMN
ncbi:probable protein phosphatase 2C 34 [Pistacia vera]|uniref:probable protein phosphatase 2C 34 n=1 Tax=Pistacia vera TaxID=55513 RepID=UPI001262DDBD|nr:probable protein phosphatase 2C 34 [Pistacia vera]XP_031277162.1 probable protein phosphatase 2C 34 [Pistacia vera]XP_031277163.1 probable protein phosphatase 2C 34 [Pistacia vera]